MKVLRIHYQAPDNIVQVTGSQFVQLKSMVFEKYCHQHGSL